MFATYVAAHASLHSAQAEHQKIIKTISPLCRHYHHHQAASVVVVVVVMYAWRVCACGTQTREYTHTHLRNMPAH